MKRLHWIPAVLGLLLALAASPDRAAAQACTTKCTCFSDGCGCESSGGNGARCDASGNGCFVTTCTVLRPVAFAPDGRALLAGELPARLAGRNTPAGKSDDAAAGPAPGTAAWESVAPGHAVARGCGGLILAEWYAPEKARELRAASRTLVL